MKNNNRRDYSKENGLRHTTKSQNQFAKNSLNSSIEKPGINESGIEAEKRGF